MGRFRDAWKTLVGKADHQIRASAQLARIEAEWCAICQEIANVLEQLNRLDARLNKREQRARKAKPQEPTHLPVTAATPPAGGNDRKAAARARFAERGIVVSAHNRLPQQFDLPQVLEDGNEPGE